MYCTTPSGTRYQTGSPGPYPVAAGGGGDRQRRHLDQRDPVGRQVAASVQSRSPAGCTPTKWASSEQLLGVLPGQDLRRARRRR